MPAQTDNNYYPALTGVRAIAAWMVFVHHFIPVRAASNPFLYNFFATFHVGVSIFFVLSGFLIYHRYQHLAKENGWFWRYVLNRFARIFPMLFLLTLLTYLISDPQIDGVPGKFVSFLLNISLLNGYSDHLKFMGIAQAWTLTVEETFYLMAPLIFLMRSKAQLLIVPVIAIILGLLLVSISGDNSLFFGDTQYMLTYTFFGRSTEFCTGIFLAMIFKNKKLHTGFNTYSGAFLILIVMLVMAVFSGELLIEAALNNLILPVCIAILFLGLLKETTWVSGILSARFFNVLGKSSYAFYLIHIGIIQQFVQAEITANPVVLFVILNVIAIGLYYLIEDPLRRLISN
jgi:peptidoglycan/LPS O-acetylase OafA/YrhL